MTGCAESMQEMLYGLHCNKTFWRKPSPAAAPAFQICDTLCNKVNDRCHSVDSLVIGPSSSGTNVTLALAGVGTAEAFCMSSYLGPNRRGVTVPAATPPVHNVSGNTSGNASGACYSATRAQMGLVVNYNDQPDMLKLHVTALMDFIVSLTLLLFYWRFGVETQVGLGRAAV